MARGRRGGVRVSRLGAGRIEVRSSVERMDELSSDGNLAAGSRAAGGQGSAISYVAPRQKRLTI